ncbi:hypothetical protein GGX14DRAFT_68927 [Mycena pura]|uniref:Uncharacterized protein n=1 Tax=Mycena pura TaxID=153505 RepID=A0AAD7E4I1_9AGAR|nr:hypothetical protein GGX14DRAFT_68927 [Mycena pura]
MSFLSPCPRPDSPPPRSPSPDVVLAPLPPPRRHTAPRPIRLSLQGAQPRPKVDKPQRTVASARSCGDFRHPPTPKSASFFAVSEPSTPRSTGSSSPSEAGFRRTHRRTLSFAASSRSRSPPPSPTVASPPPPVPPIPAFVLSPTDKKPVLHPAPTPARVNHIYLPEWEHFTVAPDGTPRKPRRTEATAIVAARRAVAAPAPMTCSTFFALHNTAEQTPSRIVAL